MYVCCVYVCLCVYVCMYRSMCACITYVCIYVCMHYMCVYVKSALMYCTSKDVLHSIAMVFFK